MTNENSPVKQMSTIPSEINWRLRNWPDLCHFFRILPRIITDESWNSFHGEISRISREWEISFRLGGHSLLRLFHPSTGYLSNRQPLPFAVSLLSLLLPHPIPPQKFVWKVGTAKWCFIVARKEDISSEEIGSFTLCPSTFQSPILHPVWFGFGKSEDERGQGWGEGRSIREVKLLGEINNLLIRAS